MLEFGQFGEVLEVLDESESMSDILRITHVRFESPKTLKCIKISPMGVHDDHFLVKTLFYPENGRHGFTLLLPKELDWSCTSEYALMSLSMKLKPKASVNPFCFHKHCFLGFKIPARSNLKTTPAIKCSFVFSIRSLV